MRPKKKILLVGVNEDRLGVLKFTLEVNRFTATCAPTAGEALDLLQQRSYDLLLCDWPLIGIERLLDQARGIDETLHSLVMAPGQSQPPDDVFFADEILRRGGCRSAELLERVKLLTARKRGPRPERKPVVSVDLASAENWRVA